MDLQHRGAVRDAGNVESLSRSGGKNNKTGSEAEIVAHFL